MLDPSSGRDAVLITPGSRVPAEYENYFNLMRVNVQPYGVIYTNNKGLANMLGLQAAQNRFANKAEGDLLIGRALFQAAGYNGIPEGADVFVSAYNKDGVQVSEVLAKFDDLYGLSVAEAVMRSHAGPDGYVEMKALNTDESWERCKDWYKRGGGIPLTLTIGASPDPILEGSRTELASEACGDL